MTEPPSRDDNETTTPCRHCPICGKPFTPVRRQAYCSNPCRQTAWRRRHTATTTVEVPPARHRTAHTIYLCSNCDTRYLAEQWCPDCVRPCRRLGLGGECGCGELITVNELLAGESMT